MYTSFDGQFRRKPHQNLGGQVGTSHRSTLLETVHKNRVKREEQRQHVLSATCIQSFVRACRVRQAIKEKWRAEFDREVANVKPETIGGLICKLLIFYDKATDTSRLLTLCQYLLSCHGAVFIEFRKSDCSVWCYRLKRLLHYNLLHIVSVTQRNGTESVAISLRMLEVFLGRQTWTKEFGTTGAIKWLCDIYLHLMEKGYFHQMRCLIEAKIPPMISKTTIPPTPLAGTLMELLSQPLNWVHSSSASEKYRLVATTNLCEAFFSTPFTEKVSLLVLPTFAEAPDFPFSHFVRILSKRKDTRNIQSFAPWMLFSFLSLAQNHLKPEFVKEFLQVINCLALSISASLVATGQSIGDEEDDDSDGEMDTADQDAVKTARSSLHLLNDGKLFQVLLTVIETERDEQTIEAIANLCHILLLSDRMAMHKFRLLYNLTFKPWFLKHLCYEIMGMTSNSKAHLVQSLAKGIVLSTENKLKVVPPLALFCSLFSNLLLSLHDVEFYGEQQGQSVEAFQSCMPFTLSELVQLSHTLTEICIGLVEIAFPESRYIMPSLRESSMQEWMPHMWEHLFNVCVTLVRQLHMWDTWRSFCPEGHWILQKALVPTDKYIDLSWQKHLKNAYRPFRGNSYSRQEMEDEGPPLSTMELRLLTTLLEMPFVIPFTKRVQLLRHMILRENTEPSNEFSPFADGPSINITVRRNYLYEDAFDKLSVRNEPNLKLRMRVQLINAVGLDEAGIDGGGIFREFLSELIKTGFDPNRGFFKLTHDNMLYPNPCVKLFVSDFQEHYYFLGRILGKAIRDNLLVELPLADFFLAKLLDKSSGFVDIRYLSSLDPVLYKNLLSLKHHDGDVADLGLDFTLVTDELGETKVVELKKGGSSVPVTSQNRIEYIHLMADFKLNKEIRAQCDAFRMGLANVISLDWLRMFSSKELQVLISGAQVQVDVGDLCANCTYAGGYSCDHPTINMFWKVVENFDDVKRRQLLKFVTSCSRPPLLGFKELHPPFCIQNAGDGDRLPTASTCMNLLKLPEFHDELSLKAKLEYAIESASGFELS